ncbi:MAG: hypothetical protein ABI601_11485 [bacterium]
MRRLSAMRFVLVSVAVIAAACSGARVVTPGRVVGAHTLVELRALPASAFVSGGGGARFGPVIDGRFLVEDPALTFETGRQNDVATLTGLNADEGSASPTYAKGVGRGVPAADDAALW